MNTKRSNNNLNLLIISVYLCIFLTPFFRFGDNFGFHTVEWGFFIVSPFYLLFTLHLLSSRKFKIDKFSCMIIFFLMALYISIIDAENTKKGLIYATQFVLYICLFITITSTLRHKADLVKFMRTLLNISVIISIIIIFLGNILGARATLNTTLVDLFALPVNKVLSFIELPFVYLLIKLIMYRLSTRETLYFLIFLIAVLFTGSRGSYLVLSCMFIVAIYTTKQFSKGLITLATLSFLAIALLYTSPFDFVKERMAKLAPTSSSSFDDKIESYSRLYTAKVAFELLKQNPVNGIGIGNISNNTNEVANKMDLPYEIIEYWERRAFYETTNSYLKIGAEIGVYGIFFIIIFYYLLWKKLKKQNNALFKNTAITYLVISGVHNFVDLGFYTYYGWIAYSFIYAVAHIPSETEVKYARTT